ncbi:lipopolysaccharide biosynthesis protein [Paenibacillus endoradicis]|uniref:lipopolysaccharide biosynthesis protein n=1 Tax=Paenibacillus endoradicis TaxID=2972487 RepID=UPI002158BBF1|nr:hypothetical protein [Paenibacillus endoradicis]MCR8660662.1 hypothetical protein [Paenibacillus endoradicis]
MNNNESRSLNSLRNMSIGIATQLIFLVVTFVSRTVFINTLGAEYLGLNGILSSTLLVLSLAELGLSNVLVFSLYKPLSERNIKQVSNLLLYFRKLYKKIIVLILIIGLLGMPFLNHITNSSISNSDIILFYVIFLSNTLLSYLIMHKVALIQADQKNYLLQLTNLICSILRDGIQIYLLLQYRNYLYYLLVLLFSTLLYNLLISLIVKNKYSEYMIHITTERIDTIGIKENIKSMFLYKIGVTLMNSSDNILIAVIFGAVYVGFYSNYSLLISAVLVFMTAIVQALMASVGNLNSLGNIKKSYEFFNVLLLVFQLIATICSLCMVFVLNDFITIWIGKEYILSDSIVFLIILNFYIQSIVNPVWMYRETFGLFSKMKYIMLYSTFIKVILSFILGYLLGIEGIFIATILARLFTTIWYEPMLLFNKIFKQTVHNYWIRQGKYILFTIISYIIVNYLIDHIILSNQIIQIALKIIISVIIVSMLFVIGNYKSEEFKQLKNIFKSIIIRFLR